MVRTLLVCVCVCASLRVHVYTFFCKMICRNQSINYLLNGRWSDNFLFYFECNCLFPVNIGFLQNLEIDFH